MADSPKPPPGKPELPSPTNPAGVHEEDAARWADGRQFTRDEIAKLKESAEERPRESFTDGDRDFPLPHENRSWITGAKRKSVWFEFGPGSLPSEMRKSEDSAKSSPAQSARYKPSQAQIDQLCGSRNESEAETRAFLESDTRDAKDMLAYLEYEGGQVPPDDPPMPPAREEKPSGEGEFR